MESPNDQGGELFAGRYQKIRHLGSGMMASVYLARDTQLKDELVALKILHRFRLAKEEFIVRFKSEVLALKNVSHENIVKIFDAGVDGAQPYFSMEYLEGETLRARLIHGVFEPDELKVVLLEILLGLAAAHKCNIIHRDLKAENIMLCASGETKLFDFGVSRPDARRPTITKRARVMGTATHAAPEVWSDGNYSFLSDIYAVGVIAYEMATGLLPFDGAERQELMRKHVMKEAEPPCVMNRDIPRWLSSLIMQTLAKEPEERPQSVDEIVGMLRSERCDYLASRRNPAAVCETLRRPLFKAEHSHLKEQTASATTPTPLPDWNSTKAPMIPATKGIRTLAPPPPPPRSDSHGLLLLGIALSAALGACIGWYSFGGAFSAGGAPEQIAGSEPASLETLIPEKPATKADKDAKKGGARNDERRTGHRSSAQARAENTP